MSLLKTSITSVRINCVGFFFQGFQLCCSLMIIVVLVCPDDDDAVFVSNSGIFL